MTCFPHLNQRLRHFYWLSISPRRKRDDIGEDVSPLVYPDYLLRTEVFDYSFAHRQAER